MTAFSDSPLGLYIHWPFCSSKCPYCDFNSHVADSIEQKRWRHAYLRELDHYGALTRGRLLSSIFFGGGTPSLAEPETFAAILDRAAFWWRLSDNAEITLEANPGTLDRKTFAAFRRVGISRVSLGVQALNDEALHFLGRRHTAAEALRAVDFAQNLFPRVSFDLIYARPGQKPGDWDVELDQALSLAAGGHLSLYQLTIEPGTRFFHDLTQGDLILPDEEAALNLWRMTQDKTRNAGMPAYEVSNHAAPGEESRHNLLYWQGGEYVGIGPGAHGRLRLDGVVYAAQQSRAPNRWLRSVETYDRAVRQETALSPRSRAEEMVMTGLRLHRGIDAGQFYSVTGMKLTEVVNPGAAALLRRHGLLAADTPLRVTAKGMAVLNAVVAALLS